MWQLDLIEGSNTLSFKRIRYIVNQNLATLVYGFNNDSENGNSNGSGKSSMLEIIAVATTGKPLRKCKADEVINDEADSAIFEVVYSNPVLGESMKIVRQIFRKSSSVVDVYIYKNGEEINEGDSKLSGVDEYNKFIMDKLGITREEFLNNFVLSKYQYENFLSVSDKDKKEIINRFSNGVLIDQAIEKLLEDMVPVKENLEASKTQVVSIEGKILAVKEQIQDELSNIETKKEDLENKKASYKTKIAEYRAEMREAGDPEEKKKQADKYSDILGDLYALDESTREEEAEEVIPKLENFCKTHNIAGGEFQSGLKNINDKFKAVSVKLEEKKKEYDTELKKLNEIQLSLDSVTEKSGKIIKESDDKMAERNIKLKSISEDIFSAKTEIAVCQDSISNYEYKINKLKKLIGGAIECPKCSHKFVLEVTESIESMNKSTESYQKIIDNNRNEILDKNKWLDDLKCKKDVVLDEIDIIEDETANVTSELSRVRLQITQVSAKVNVLSKEMKELEDRSNECENVVNDFINECIDFIEGKINIVIEGFKTEAESIEKIKSRINLQIESALGSIESLEATKPEDGISDLKDRLGKYEKDLSQADRVKNKCQKEFDKYSAQEVLFNEYKTYLANTKINALSEVTNSFLEEIGSELRVKFNGYTMLKSGKMREKISIELLRDGMEVGSFGKLSVGEAARINLACILAMNKLININCDQNKGLNLLVLDEICDGVDNQGLMSMLGALNRIGITSIFISHGQIAENYEHYIKIVKENGESKIDD